MRKMQLAMVDTAAGQRVVVPPKGNQGCFGYFAGKVELASE
jgi:hypothetical protein